MQAVVVVVAIVAHGRPLPPRLFRAIRHLGSGPDALAPQHSPPSWGRQLAHPILRAQLADRQFGIWSMGVQTIQLLENEILRHKPKLVLEFGSGVSTVCLTRFMVDVHGSDTLVQVVSFEQDERFARETRDALQVTGLAEAARVVWAPLAPQRVEGLETVCYDMPDDLSAILDERTAELVVIDGPSADAGSRFGTLPLAANVMAAGARFVLDDALRDSELMIAERWSRLPYVKIEGIRLIDHGLLTGWVQGS